MKRFRFIIKRLLSMIVIMFLVSFLVFVVLRMSDADPLTVMIGNNQSTPELRQALTEKYHLDDPVHIQYLRWIKGVLSGDFGTDYVDGQDVKGLIMSRLPITFGLVIMSSVIGSVIAVIMGVAAALRKGRPSDAAISGLMLVLSGAPSFLVSILILIFMTKYVPGYSFIGTYTNFGEFLQRIMIPSLIMALTFVAMLGRITRSNMISQLQSPYIATAAAKGLKQSNITYKHAFHNAVIPVITVAGYMIAGSIGSTVIVEQVFSLPGIGGLLISAIEENNFPIVQILVLFMLGAYLVMSFVIDILYTVLDPRVDLKFLAVIVFVSLFASVIAPYDPLATDVNAIYAPAFSEGHIFGTDGLGRDIFSRLICSARTSILNAFLIVAIEVVIGVPLGLICGYYRGPLDSIVMRVWDVISAIPPLLLSFILIAVMGKGMMTGIIAIGISYIPLTTKTARSMIMTEKKAVYVEACKSMGFSDARIIFVHILPNIITPMISQFTLDIGTAITSMATLSFLGLGVQAPNADWGTLLRDGMGNLYNSSALLFIPAICVILVTVSINLFSDGVQNYLDPSSRKLPSFKKYEKKHRIKKLSAVKANGEA